MIIQKDLNGKVLGEFQSKAAAARAVGIDEASIRRSIKFGRKVFGKFKYYISDDVLAHTSVNKSKAKILLFDSETSPLLAMVFQKQVWKAKIGYDKVVSDYYFLSWAAKWLGDNAVMSDVLTPEEALKEDDSRIIRSLWKLIDEADVVIAHNCAFDIPNFNTRSVKHGLMPPSPYKIVDTLKTAQQQFGFTHNSLGALAKFFDLEGKIETDFGLWKGCISGDEGSLFVMETYNVQDVVVLENVFLKLRPYMRGFPNLDLYTDDAEPSCPHCGSKHIELIKDKFFYTQSVKYETYRCECGAISRSKTGLKYNNKKQVSAIPR